MQWKIWLVVALIILLLLAIKFGVWRQLRKSENMLKTVDKSKLKDLSKDGWEDD